MRFFLIPFLSLIFSFNSNAQVGGRIGLSIPNGVELGADVRPSEIFRVGANYGYLHHADAANLQMAVGKKVYFFGTLNVINVNKRGRLAIATALDDLIVKKSNEPQNTSFKRVISGYHVESEDFKMTDLGIGGGIGYKYGIFFIEGGIRTSKMTSITDKKVDTFIDSLKDHVNENERITFVERDLAMQEIEYMRGDVKKQIRTAFGQAPGNLKILPEIRIGIRIPLGKK